jgi:hypothetical protein
MRCGPPDALDLMVAANYGTLAADLLLAKQSAAWYHCCTHVSMTRHAGARKVDIEALYDGGLGPHACGGGCLCLRADPQGRRIRIDLDVRSEGVVGRVPDRPCVLYGSTISPAGEAAWC